MIVKDESLVIQKCLASVKRLIDYWVIVDTGSTDGTQSIIREFLKEIPGELHERPWVDFAHNRNEALAFAKNKGDYLLFIDADECLVFNESFAMPALTSDCYLACIQMPEKMIFYRRILIKNSLKWKWQGVVHEEVVCAQTISTEILCGAINVASKKGNRSRSKNQFLHDSALLEKALQDDPDNTRNRFYLALSYGNADKLELALKNHEIRVGMGGEHQEEVFYSMLMIAVLQEALKMKPEIFINSYCRACLYRPSRIEPFYGLACYFINTKNYLLGYLISRYTCMISRCTDLLFVHFRVYEYEALVQFAECAFQIGRIDESRSAMEKLLTKKSLPDEMRDRIEKVLEII